jgi:hypothetical protein
MGKYEHCLTDALAARVINNKADNSVTSSNALLRPEATKYLRSQILFCKNSSYIKN